VTAAERTDATTRPRSRGPATSELVPLDARVQWLAALRIALTSLTLLARLALPHAVTGSLDDLLLATALYLIVQAVAELIRLRVGHDRTLLTTMLLVDGVYLAYVMHATGPDSVLRSLILLHLVAVTLLVSYRSGLKVAAWHLILLFAVEGTSGADGGDPSRTLLFGISVLLIGGGTAAFSAVNERELRRRRSDLEALHDFAVALDHARHAAEVAQVLAERSQTIADLGGALVVAHRAGTDAVLAAVGDAGSPAGAVIEVHPGSVLAEAWTHHQAVLVRELDPELDAYLVQAFQGAPNVVVVPMFNDGQPAGAVVGTVRGVRKNRVERNVVATLEQLTAHAALALRNAWLLHDVEELAVTDELTRLANRRELEASLARELSSAKEQGTAVGFVLVDLDRFKVLNDTHGHLTGDEVLRRVSDVLVGVTELGDTVARYGGEEFALVLPGRDPMATAAAAERACLAIAAIQGPAQVTASLGACSYPADAADGSALMRAADEALYESKRAGRNCVTSAAGRATGWLDLPWRADEWSERRAPVTAADPGS
jgi:diguanylate cyclase (GGDEF)-like protein